MSVNFQETLEDAFKEAGNKTVREALFKEIKPLNKQEAKADAGKPQLTLVPRQILFDIAEVRAFGVKKYNDPDNWKQVDIQRYRDAAFRHFMAYLDDPQGNDKESGLPHLAHLACNIAFLCELESKENRNNETIDISND